MASFSKTSSGNLHGIAFPFSLGEFSVPKTASGLTAVVSAVKSLLLTGTGELPMESDVGTNLHSFVFSSVTSLNLARLSSEVRRVVGKWEPRMKILSVTTTNTDDIGLKSGVIVHIEYELDGEVGDLPIPTGF